MKNETHFRLTYETDDERLTWEFPYIDPPLYKIIEMFYGMLITATWQPDTIIRNMREFVELHTPEEPEEDGTD